MTTVRLLMAPIRVGDEMMPADLEAITSNGTPEETPDGCFLFRPEEVPCAAHGYAVFDHAGILRAIAFDVPIEMRSMDDELKVRVSY